MKRATPKIRAVEEQYGKPLRDVLRELINKYGKQGAAATLGITPSLLSYWLMREHLDTVQVVVGFDEEAIVRKKVRV